jgi:hypothetical protein
MTGVGKDRRLTTGWILVFAVSVAFILFSVVGILNPLRGEEELTNITYEELEATNPGLADTIWHYNTGIWIIVDGVAVLMAALAFTQLRHGSRQAWFTILWLAIVFVASILAAHLPVGHPGVGHWGPPVVLTGILIIGLWVASKPVLSARHEALPADKASALSS